MSEQKRVFAHAQSKKKTQQDCPEKPEVDVKSNKQEFEKKFLCNPNQDQ